MSFDKLISKKSSNQAIILGNGPSINDLSEEEWSIIESIDKWVLNTWMIHDVVPDFYHLEIKKHRNGSIVKQILSEKKEKYKNVNWILDGTRKYLFEYVNPKVFKNIFRYKKRYIKRSSFSITSKTIG